MVIVEVNNSHLCNWQHDHLFGEIMIIILIIYIPTYVCTYEHEGDAILEYLFLSILSSPHFLHSIILRFLFPSLVEVTDVCRTTEEKQKNQKVRVIELQIIHFLLFQTPISLVLGTMKIRLVAILLLTVGRAGGQEGRIRCAHHPLTDWLRELSNWITKRYIDTYRENKTKVPFGAVVGSA